MQTANTMLPEDMQASNEFYYGRRHIDRYIRNELEKSSDLMQKVAEGTMALTNWVKGPFTGQYAERKQARLDRLDVLQFSELVTDIFVATCYCQRPELYSSVVARLANRLSFEEHKDNILTLSEIVALLSDTGVYAIYKPGKYASLTIQSNVELPEKLVTAIARSEYLPPMVSEPVTLRSNYKSPFLTFNECQILGPSNSHDGCISLDMINQQNQVPLSLNEDFLTQVSEDPTHTLDTQEKQAQWEHFLEISRHMYHLMLQQGNRFYLTNKVDKRGRMYAQGYHITTQGSPYKKAMLEFADKELVEGVPDEYRT